MLGKTTNPELQKVEQAVQAKVPPEMQNAFQRIVTAGMVVMYSDKTRQMLTNQLRQQGDPAIIAGEGVAKLMAILYQQSKRTMPMRAAIPAAQLLLCEGLGFMADAGMVQISNELIAQATQEMITYLLQIFGFSKQKIQQYIQAGMQKQGGSAAPAAIQPAAPAQPGGIIAAARGA
jgi:hypothetical protein